MRNSRACVRLKVGCSMYCLTIKDSSLDDNIFGVAKFETGEVNGLHNLRQDQQSMHISSIPKENSYSANEDHSKLQEMGLSTDHSALPTSGLYLFCSIQISILMFKITA